MANDPTKKWKIIPRQVVGVRLNGGIGLGQAMLHHLLDNKDVNQEAFTGNAEGEWDRLERAFQNLGQEIRELISQQPSAPSPLTKSQAESQDILGTYLLLTNDAGWRRQVKEKVEKGVNALEAVDKTLESIREKLNRKGTPALWQERIRDFEDLTTRLKRHLQNPTTVERKKTKDQPFIIVADRIGPAELLDYNREKVAGLVLEEASQTSHVTIVARSLGIPVVGGIKDVFRIVKSEDPLVIDGDEGCIYLHPSEEVIHYFDKKSLLNKNHLSEPLRETMATLPAQTKDGVLISLFLNAGLVEDVNYIEASGTEGIGLYRTEIPFMMHSKLPNVVEQTKLYREILTKAGHYPVTFRTLDVGGDKILPYLERLKSENPLIEKRMERLFLDRPILLRYQIRALIRACAGHELTLMLPMIAQVSEVKAARELIDREMAREQEKGNAIPTKIYLGAMVEVPSLVYQLPDLFPYIDFLSVGSNDLFQFFYGIDRTHPQLSNQHDVLSPPFLNLLKFIQDQCQTANIPLSLCGEMAGRPLEAMALIGLGYRSLSMSAAAIPTIKHIIRQLNCQKLIEYLTTICLPSQQLSIRGNLCQFAKDHGIDVG